jgi:glycogen debranching enzyme
MDNQPRLEKGYNPEFSHGFMSWIDISLQQIFVGKILMKMATILNREEDVKDIASEIDDLQSFVNTKMYDEKSTFYYDVWRNGKFNYVKSIAAYWALLADVVPQENEAGFLAHLENENEFARPHRPTTLSADDAGYQPDGGYWCGGVWAPTTYMLLRGLTLQNKDSLAFRIAENHFFNVIRVYNETDTFWENYAPETGFFPANSRRDFVGWTGITPISILFEYIFGIRPQTGDHQIVWDIRLTDAFSVKNYPFGVDGSIDFQCSKRKSMLEKPKITIKSNKSLKVKLVWEGGAETVVIKAKK